MPSMPGRAAVSDLFKASLPVAFGYLPLGAAFGILLSSSGLAWWWAPVMSSVVFAGSAQFLAVSLLASGAGPAEAFAATLLLNLRHIFYGLTLLDRYRALGRKRSYAIFGLTDETFSLMAGTARRADDASFVLSVTALNHFWWISGSTLGALLGRAPPFPTKGLEFSLTALFAVLLAEQFKKGFEPAPILSAAAASVLCLIVLPGRLFLISAIGLASLALAFLPWKGRIEG